MRKKVIGCALVLFVLSLLLSACASNGGILGGGNWQISGLSGKHILTLAVDTNNAQNVYAGDSQGDVFASTDGGQHWAARDSGLSSVSSINYVSFDASGKKLYAATSQGLFVSTDGARQWSAVNVSAKGLTTHNFIALAFDLNAAHTIYLATATNVYMSADNGTSWTALSEGLPASIAINGITYETSAHRLWAATSTGVYRYTSAAASWQAMNNGLPGNIQVFTVQPASNVGETAGLVYIGTSQGFFRSVNAGNLWQQSAESLQRTQIHAVFVDFQQNGTVYVGTNVGVLVSTDSGQDWGGVGPGLPTNQQVTAIQLGASGYTQLFAASANGVYYFPGSSGGLSATNLIPIVIILVLFYLLYRFTRRNQRRQQVPTPPSPNGKPTDSNMQSPSPSSAPAPKSTAESPSDPKP
jgi:photosystem II stability/assembly factor-like uncharacterized protein